MENKVTTTPNKVVSAKDFFGRKDVVDKFTQILGNNSSAFVSSLMNIVSNSKLSTCSPTDLYSCAVMAASLKLPINPNLGFAYIIPYETSVKVGNSWEKVTVPQFQLGYKGLIQLAIRSGEYKYINALPVYQNQFKSYNALTEELDADFSIEGTGKPIGYVASFELTSGFRKLVYWTTEKVTQHAGKYSQAYKSEKGKSPWKDENQFDGMACKTVLKNTLSKWGILSVDMQRAILADQAVVKGDATTEEATFEYVDNGTPSKEEETANKEADRFALLIDNCSTLEDVVKLKKQLDLIKENPKFEDLQKALMLRESDLEEFTK